MDYLDFEICVGKGAGGDYPLHVVRSPAGERRGTMQFPLNGDALRLQLQALEIAVLKSGGTRRDLVAPAEHGDVEAFGRTLFGALLPEAIREGYRLSRQQAEQEGKGLRLRLRIEAPDLAALPWEFLYDDSEGDFVCLSSNTPVVRYLELNHPPAPLAVEPPLRVLGMIASPGDRTALDVELERARMTEALGGLEAQGRVALTWLDGQTWRDLKRAMRQGSWHVFHFIGHGGFDAASGEGQIALADGKGGTRRLSAKKLGLLLNDHKLRMVVLNACEGAQASGTNLFSSTASVLAQRGIPAVVAMQYEITDRAAIEFSHTFYEVIAEGLPVDRAVAEARKAVSLSAEHTVEWGTPVLHMRAPDGRLLPPPPPPPPPPGPVVGGAGPSTQPDWRPVVALSIVALALTVILLVVKDFQQEATPDRPVVTAEMRRDSVTRPSPPDLGGGAGLSENPPVPAPPTVEPTPAEDPAPSPIDVPGGVAAANTAPPSPEDGRLEVERLPPVLTGPPPPLPPPPDRAGWRPGPLAGAVGSPLGFEITELNPVFFEYGALPHGPTPSMASRLDENVEVLLQSPSLCVRVHGYSDGVEPGDARQTSEDRAHAVVAYYESRGVDPTRLLAVGQGEDLNANPKEDAGPGDSRARRVDSLPQSCQEPPFERDGG